MNTELYFVRFYDNCGGKAYRDKSSALRVLLRSYVENIDGWELDIDDIKNDLKTFLDDDWIEDFGEIVNIELVEGE